MVTPSTHVVSALPRAAASIWLVLSASLLRGGEPPHGCPEVDFGGGIHFVTGRIYEQPLETASASDFFTADMNGDGKSDLVTNILRPTGTHTEHGPVWGPIISVFLNEGGMSFAQPFWSAFPPPDGYLTDSLVPGDFDSDGDTDVAVLNFYDADFAIPRKMVLLANDGSGKLSSQGEFEVGDHPVHGVAADLDRDGDLDLAVSRFHQNKRIEDLSVLINQGGGVFDPPRTFPAVPSQREIAAGDLDGDGLPEIVVGGSQGEPPFYNAGGVIGVLLNLGGGEFGEPRVRRLSHTENVMSVQVGDIDKDGWLDVVSGSADLGRITVLWNDGVGGFLDEFTELQGIATLRLRLGDMDGDGLLDLVSRGCLIHRNLGSRRFAPPVAYGAGFWSMFDLADFDGDGALDFASQSTGSETVVSVIRNRGNGRLEAARVYNIGQSTLHWDAGWMLGADFDRDGDPDLAVQAVKSDSVFESVVILENQDDGTFEAAQRLTYYDEGDFHQLHMIAAELDGDGDLDLATSGIGPYSGVGLLWNDGEGGFSDPVRIPLALAASQARPIRIAAEDFDSDGDPDLVTGNNFSRFGLSFLWNLGPGNFGEEQDIDISVPGEPTSPVKGMVAGDFDSDGDPDVALVQEVSHFDPSPSRVNLFTNEGSRTFTRREIAAIEGVPASIEAEDLDSDGKLDLLVGSYYPPDANLGDLNQKATTIFTLLAQRDSGTFERRQSRAPAHSAGAKSLHFGDLDRDGDLDLAVSGGGTYSVVLLNDGSGRFGQPVQYVTDSGQQVIVIDDFNLDGKMDLAAACDRFGNVAVLLNEAPGSGGTPGERPFRRGDVNASSRNDTMADALSLLHYFFLGAVPLACPKAGDVDDNGQLDLTDPIYLLRYAFIGGPVPPEPFRCCGLDPTPDDLDCAAAQWQCQ